MTRSSGRRRRRTATDIITVRVLPFATVSLTMRVEGRAPFRPRFDPVTSLHLPAEIARCLDSLAAELDHKNLNHDVAGLTNRPKTTESIAQYLHARVAAVLPVHRVRLHERDDFFAEYWESGDYFLGMRRPFSAAHRLHAPGLSAAENFSLYGKCNNPRGHGHRYLTEATIGGRYDERSGTLYSYSAFRDGIERALRPWQDKHLDLETEEFREKPSTGENIVRALWPKFKASSMIGSFACGSGKRLTIASPCAVRPASPRRALLVPLPGFA